MTRWYDDEPCYERPTIEVSELERKRRLSWRWLWPRRKQSAEEVPFGFARSLYEGEP